MTLLPRIYTVHSEKNGPISVRQFLWFYSVYAGGFEQSGPYLVGLWRDALRRVAQEGVERVLMLGLGGGSGLAEIEKRFPRAAVTVIEWDPAMVEVAQRLRLYRSEPELLVGDACDIVPRLPHRYDLIMSDIFYGDAPEPRQGEERLGTALAKALAPGGRLIVNASRALGLLDAMARFLRLESTWRFRDNTLGMLRSDLTR